ncbi:ROK family protein [Desemzia sp. RIT804]|uniref:ROK family protein n=1 Tax=Desemzia sp. RIT 804 TaxID=2810209 RepID=UPI00194F01E6|nr:ROK family protein [Desemzia sp. RIT 804]MBM6614927.1 ROK family protein [Desemzia sp. RIT 804]
MNVISIDIGGTYIKSAIVSQCDIKAKQIRPTPTKDRLELLHVIDTIIEEYQALEVISCIGFSVPGSVDESGTVSFGGAVESLNGLSLKRYISEKYQVTVKVENDAKAATIGEFSKGNLKGVNNGVAIILGTGVGVGLLLDGKIRKGPHFQAGEVSFLIQDKKITGPESFVGLNLSAVRLVHRLSEELSVEADGKLVFEIFKQTDQSLTKEIFKDYCTGIAVLCFNLQCLLDIEKIVIGGGISQQTILIKGIKDAYQEIFLASTLIEKTIAQVTIDIAKFQADANLIGAVEGIEYE